VISNVLTDIKKILMGAIYALVFKTSYVLTNNVISDVLMATKMTQMVVKHAHVPRNVHHNNANFIVKTVIKQTRKDAVFVNALKKT
jgi:hypothetical protein